MYLLLLGSPPLSHTFLVFVRIVSFIFFRFSSSRIRKIWSSPGRINGLVNMLSTMFSWILSLIAGNLVLVALAVALASAVAIADTCCFLFTAQMHGFRSGLRMGGVWGSGRDDRFFHVQKFITVMSIEIETVQKLERWKLPEVSCKLCYVD